MFNQQRRELCDSVLHTMITRDEPGKVFQIVGEHQCGKSWVMNEAINHKLSHDENILLMDYDYKMEVRFRALSEQSGDATRKSYLKMFDSIDFYNLYDSESDVKAILHEIMESAEIGIKFVFIDDLRYICADNLQAARLQSGLVKLALFYGLTIYTAEHSIGELRIS